MCWLRYYNINILCTCCVNVLIESLLWKGGDGAYLHIYRIDHHYVGAISMYSVTFIYKKYALIEHVYYFKYALIEHIYYCKYVLIEH